MLSLLLSFLKIDESEIKHTKTQLSVEETVPLDLAVEVKPEVSFFLLYYMK